MEYQIFNNNFYLTYRNLDFLSVKFIISWNLNFFQAPEKIEIFETMLFRWFGIHGLINLPYS